MRKSLILAAMLLTAVAFVGCRNKPPKTPLRPIGADEVAFGDTETYRTVTTDPNRDDIDYIYDWGTESDFDTTALMRSGDTVGLAFSWADTGWYAVKVRARDENGNLSPAWSDTHLVHVLVFQNRKPDAPAKPAGPDSGWVNTWHSFSTSATDPDGDSVRITFYWDDGMVSLPLRAASGQTVTDSVRYTSGGVKRIRATALDPAGLRSDTSETKQFLSLQVNTRPGAPFMAGPVKGIANGPYYRFYATSTDPENNRIQYRFFLGTDTSHGWTPFRFSGQAGVDSFRFPALGTYPVRAIARDSLGLVSDTSLAWSFEVVGEGSVIWNLGPAEEFVSSPALGPITYQNELRPGVVAGSTEGFVWGIDAYQAAQLYRTPSSTVSPEGFSSSPAIGSDGTVYIGCDDGRFFALSNNGQQKWTFPDTITGSAVNSTPVIDGSAAYFSGEDMYLRRVRDDGSSRALVWSYYLGDEAYSSPVMLPNGNVVVCDDSGYVHWLDQNGSRLYRYATGATISSSPAVGPDGTVYFGTDLGIVYALRDGNLIWSFTVPPPQNDVRSSPVLDAAGNVYFGSNTGSLYKLSPLGSLMLEVPLGVTGITATPLLCADGVIYVATDDDTLRAVNADGTQRWAVGLRATDGPNRGEPRRFDLDFAPSPVVDQYGIIYVAGTYGVFAIAGRPAGTLLNSAWPMFHRDVKHTGKF